MGTGGEVTLIIVWGLPERGALCVRMGAEVCTLLWDRQRSKLTGVGLGGKVSAQWCVDGWATEHTAVGDGRDGEHAIV